MENKMQGFNTIFFYFNNYKSVEFNGKYVPEVLVKADFTCSNTHMVSKWLGYNAVDGTIALWNLYGELDKDNRRALLGWIFKNYNCIVGL